MYVRPGVRGQEAKGRALARTGKSGWGGCAGPRGGEEEGEAKRKVGGAGGGGLGGAWGLLQPGNWMRVLSGGALAARRRLAQACRVRTRSDDECLLSRAGSRSGASTHVAAAGRGGLIK